MAKNGFTEPYRRLCATPIVIRLIRVLPYVAYWQPTRPQALPICRSVFLNSGAAWQWSTEVAAETPAELEAGAVVRLPGPATFDGHQQSFRRMSARVGVGGWCWDGGEECMSILHSGMCLVLSSAEKQSKK